MPENALAWNNFLEHAELSDVGLRRSNNQDCYCVAMAGDQREWRERGHVFMVADGMGAHAAGELASKLACGGVAHTYHKLLDRGAPDALRQAIIQTNSHIHGRGQANAEFHGMGTTCSVLTILPQGALLGQVGDSRIYRLRGTRLEQLTFDHSLVWEMMASGQLPAGNPGNFVPKNIITRSLGPHAEVKVDLEGPFPLETGDIFLICSDGLSGQVRDDQIGYILGTMSPDEAVRALVDLANLNGGPDNTTVIVIRVTRALPPAAGDAVFRPPAAAHKSFSLHPAVWVAIGVALLVAIGLALTGKMIVASICIGVALVTAIAGAFQSLGSKSDDGGGIAGPFGKGPHTSCECRPNRESLDELAGYAQKLREAATDQSWKVNWGQFNTLVEAANSAAAAGKFDVAIRQMLLAISFMMNEIRHQRPKPQARDSSVIDL